MSETQPKKRVRKRSLAVQLQIALRDAEAAATADISTQKLIQTRLNILSKALARERHDELKAAKTENERLRQELATALAKPAARLLTDVELALQNYEKEKGRTA